jgi:uncharacterized protein (DUF2062 family)
MRKLKVLAKKYLFHPIQMAVLQGVSHHEIALTIALGAVVGVIPLFGVSTALLILIAIMLRLNVVLIQAINYAVYPLQFILYIPFIKAGNFLYSSPITPESFHEFITMAKASWVQAIQYFGLATIWAIIAWFMLGIPVGVILYLLSRRVTKLVGENSKQLI